MSKLSEFEKQAVAEIKRVEEQATQQLEKVADEAVSKFVTEVSGKSITCCGWKWSLQISRQTQPPSPAKSEETSSKSSESASPSKQESV